MDKRYIIKQSMWRYLRDCYCETECFELMGNKLYYDEGNEEPKLINGLDGREYFWSELNEDEQNQLIDAFEDYYTTYKN